jgi:small subunit ribosomal protein S6
LRLYEGMFLLDSNLATKDWASLETHIQDIMKRNRAEILYSEKWPDRKLAYDVKGCKKGTYYLTYFNAPSEAIRAIEHDCGLSERILRILIIQEPGLDREMERRKNREITAPPSELSFEDERFEGRDFGFGGRRRSAEATEKPQEKPVEVVPPPPPPQEVAAGPAEETDAAPEGEEAAG